MFTSHWASRHIDKITRSEIRELLLRLYGSEALSQSNISLIRDVIGGSLTFALDSELIPRNLQAVSLKSCNSGETGRLRLNF